MLNFRVYVNKQFKKRNTLCAIFKWWTNKHDETAPKLTQLNSTALYKIPSQNFKKWLNFTLTFISLLKILANIWERNGWTFTLTFLSLLPGVHIPQPHPLPEINLENMKGKRLYHMKVDVYTTAQTRTLFIRFMFNTHNYNTHFFSR